MKRVAIAMTMGMWACGGGSTDVEPTLRFADRSDGEISRLISAAGGSDMFGAQAQIDSFAGETDPCPGIAVSGDEVTISGGCTTADGLMIEGEARVVNAIGWDEEGAEYSFGRDTEYRMTGFAITRQGFVQRMDGFMNIEDMFTTWDADVTTESAGVVVRSDIHYECGGTSCDLSGSGIELVGVGGALVSGEVEVGGGTSHAEYTLEGADELTAVVDQGCVRWSIDGGEEHKVGACP